MTDETKAPKIVPPEPHRRADLGRATARAIAGAIPVAGSAATELVNMLPDPTAIGGSNGSATSRTASTTSRAGSARSTSGPERDR